ncbi:hypothetical protein AXL1_75 [Stenotrophomonas phage vB_SmaS-AXL_1]|uniref:hypothetical protein n=1 Tax=Stenotrophomonas phage vB_SmaS-AXL_1 TaxID=2909581 RepID=UPI00240980AD|nr:hypothetical protein P9A52_gp75 [Stenotrophomonas phage vB_SmaS-AXL_1]UIS24802.1 hypothetical protein AXL1_75 [Stenotrophomonas phage vB_SmaS-AXL_1]
MMSLIEEAAYQFLKDDNGWALYDADDRSEVRGTRSPQLGNSIWAAASELGLTKEGETDGR